MQRQCVQWLCVTVAIYYYFILLPEVLPVGEQRWSTVSSTYQEGILKGTVAIIS